MSSQSVPYAGRALRRSPTRNLCAHVGVALVLVAHFGMRLKAQSAPSLSEQARALLEQRNVRGGVVLMDASSGIVLASAYSDSTIMRGVYPLSTVKLLLAAVAWNHGIRADAGTLLTHGNDSAGRSLALVLRQRLGTKRVLSDVARLGFPRCRTIGDGDCLDLEDSTSDSAWASTFSIGESNARVTLPHLAGVLRILTNERSGILSPSTVRRLKSGMLDVVQHGTATSIRDALGTRGRIGGKTGSGGAGPGHLNGVFAAFVTDAHDRVRYTVVAYTEDAGFGGGTAAGLAADLAALALADTSQQASRLNHTQPSWDSCCPIGYSHFTYSRWRPTWRPRTTFRSPP